MTLDEKLTIGCKAVELKNIGDREGYERLMKTIPVPPYHVKAMKETFGLNYLMDSGWNLSEAEAEFGSDWLYTAQNSYIEKQKEVIENKV